MVIVIGIENYENITWWYFWPSPTVSLTVPCENSPESYWTLSIPAALRFRGNFYMLSYDLHRDNVRLWCWFGSKTAHMLKKKDWRGKAANCHTKVCFFSVPDRCAIPSRALRHESITTLSTGHLCMSYLPRAPSIYYNDGHVSGDEKKNQVTQTTDFFLTSWQFNRFI